MKKQVSIALGALQFLHRVLGETGVVSRPDARKQSAAFKCMESFIVDMNDKLNTVRKKYRQNKPYKDQAGNEQDRWIVPEEKKEAFEKEILEIENTKVEVLFDRESLAVVNHALDQLFVRQQALVEKGESHGVAGATTMKLIEEASAALEAAKDVQ